MDSYSATIQELYSKIKLNPLQTTFDLYEGCKDKETAENIAQYLNQQGIKASVNTYFRFFTKYYLSVYIPVPSSITCPNLKKKEVVNYIETYVPPCRGLLIGSVEI